MPFIVTAFAGGALAVLMVPLSLQVTLRRIQLGNLVFGHGDDDTLRRRIRAHGNFCEYAPTGMVALGLLEASGAASAATLWALAVALVAGRLLHAAGMLYGDTPLARAIAMMTTHAVLLTAGVWLMATALG